MPLDPVHIEVFEPPCPMFAGHLRLPDGRVVNKPGYAAWLAAQAAPDGDVGREGMASPDGPNEQGGRP